MSIKRQGKRIVTNLIIFAVIATVFSGCGKKPVVNQNEINEGKRGKITVTIYDRGTIPSSEGSMVDNRWTKWINENAPCDVEFVSIPRKEGEQKLNMLFASASAPDVIFDYDGKIPTFVTKKMAFDLTDLVDKYMPNYKARLDNYPLVKKTVSRDGKIYMVANATPIGPNHTIVIRKDWLEKLGLDFPKTPEELFSVAQAFSKQDPDQNGKADTFGISLSKDGQRVLSHMFGYGNPEIWKFESGNISVAWDRIEDALKYEKRFVEAKLVDPDFVLDNGDKSQKDFINGKLGIFITGRLIAGATSTEIYKSLIKNNPEAQVATFQLPATKYGQYTAYTTGGVSVIGMLNREAKDPVSAAKYLNWLMDEKVSEYLKMGPEDVYYKKDEEGTFIIVDSEKNKVEKDYNQDYYMVLADADPKESMENAVFNQLWKGNEPQLYPYADLRYFFGKISNVPGAVDPRRWQEYMPQLDTSLMLIKSNSNKAIDDIFIKCLAKSDYSAEQAMGDAKEAWKNAGGDKLEAFYNESYQKDRSTFVVPEDFEKLKYPPEVLPTAKKNASVDE